MRCMVLWKQIKINLSMSTNKRQGRMKGSELSGTCNACTLQKGLSLLGNLKQKNICTKIELFCQQFLYSSCYYLMWVRIKLFSPTRNILFVYDHTIESQCYAYGINEKELLGTTQKEGGQQQKKIKPSL